MGTPLSTRLDGATLGVVATNTYGVLDSGVTDAKIATVSASKLTGTVDPARVTSASAGKPLVMNNAGTAIVGGPRQQLAYITVDQSVAVGTATLSNFSVALTITSGKLYSYRMKLFCIASGGTANLAAGSFATGGSAGSAAHARGTSRINSNTYGSSAVEAADFITTTTAYSVLNTSLTLAMFEGVIDCNGTGTITPSVTVGANTIVFRKGSTFELTELN